MQKNNFIPDFYQQWNQNKTQAANNRYAIYNATK